MHDAVAVGGIQGIGDLNGQIEQFIQRQWMAREVLIERLALHQLHSDEVLAFGLADLVNGADVGMVEGRGGAGFLGKALQCLRVSDEIFGQELHPTAQGKVFGGPDGAHAAGANAVEHTVMGNLANDAPS